MGSFAKSFEESFKTGAAIGSNAALEQMKEKNKLETEKAAKATTLANIKAIGIQQAEKVATMDIDSQTKKYIEDSLGVLGTLNDPEVAQKHLTSTVGLVENSIKSKMSAMQTSKEDQYKSGMLGITEVIKSLAERGGTFDDGTPITASSLQDFGLQASDRLLQRIGSMPTDTSGNPIDTNRPKIQNKGGSFSTEKTITQEEADANAVQRSKDIGEIRSKDGGLLSAPIRSKASFKAEEKKASDTAVAENTSKGTFRFMQQFDRSISELKKFDPEFDKEGAQGWLNRRMASVAKNLDELPETRALEIQVLPMANGMAREIEGGRVTDNDRKIYADSFANGIRNPSSTNMRLLSQSLISLLDKGGNSNGAITKQLSMLAKSKTDMFKGVIVQVLEEYPELAPQIYGEGFEVQE